jgi:hypothetical protein
MILAPMHGAVPKPQAIHYMPAWTSSKQELLEGFMFACAETKEVGYVVMFRSVGDDPLKDCYCSGPKYDLMQGLLNTPLEVNQHHDEQSTEDYV